MYYSQITTTNYCAITKCYKLRVLLEICIVEAAYLYQQKPGAIGATE